MKILFVINPKAGNYKKNDLKDKLSKLSKQHDYIFKMLFTKGSDDKIRIKKTIQIFKPSAVIAVGGDGTINLVASQLINKNINLGIIPTGSANGMAYELSITGNIEKAFLKVVNKKPKPIDVIRINDKYNCIHLSDTGINARVVKRFEKEGSKGIGGYAKQLIAELFSTNSKFKVELEFDKLKKTGKAEMLVIANAKSYGTGAKINPLGKPDDGIFEIVMIKPYPWWFIFKLIISFFTGTINALNNVKIYQTKNVNIRFRAPQDLQIDGEIIEGLRSFQAKIIHQALKVYY